MANTITLNSYGLSIDQIKELTIQVLRALPDNTSSGLKVSEAIELITGMDEVNERQIKVTWEK